jgi:Holliday junction DNA helicase RuvB
MPDTIEDVYEPFLLQHGLIQRTRAAAWLPPALTEHLGITRMDSLF